MPGAILPRGVIMPGYWYEAPGLCLFLGFFLVWLIREITVAADYGNV